LRQPEITSTSGLATSWSTRRGNVDRVVLEIAVERHDELAGRDVEAGLERRRLAVVADQVDGLQPVARGGELFEDARGAVARTVVDADQLEAAAGRRDRVVDARDEVPGRFSASL
jgi:hypothetical protein